MPVPNINRKARAVSGGCKTGTCQKPAPQLLNNCGCPTSYPHCPCPPAPAQELMSYQTTTQTYVKRVPKSKICYPYELKTPYCAFSYKDQDQEISKEMCCGEPIKAFLFKCRGKIKQEGDVAQTVSEKKLKEAFIKEFLTDCYIENNNKHLIMNKITPKFCEEDMQSYLEKGMRIVGKRQTGCFVEYTFILNLGCCKKIENLCDLACGDVGFTCCDCTYITFHLPANKDNDLLTEKSLLFEELVSQYTPTLRREWFDYTTHTLEGTRCWKDIPFQTQGKLYDLWIIPDKTLDDGVEDLEDLSMLECQITEGGAEDPTIENTTLNNFDLFRQYVESPETEAIHYIFGCCDSSCWLDITCKTKLQVKGKAGSKIKIMYSVVT